MGNTYRVFPGWWQVAVSLVLQAASSASIFTAYSIIAVPLEKTFEPSRMVLMLGIPAVVAATGVLSPVIGAAIDKFSIRLLMLAGTFILGLGFVLLSFASSMNQVLLIYLIPMAMSCVLTGPVAGSALLARWFNHRRGLAISIAAGGAAVGGLIIPPLLQYLIATFEWRAALQIFGVGVFAITAPLVALVVVSRPAERNLAAYGDVVTAGSSAAPAQPKTLRFGFFLRQRDFWLVAVCLGLLFSGPMGLLTNFIPFLEEKNIAVAQGALLLSVFSAANIAGKLGSGAIADKLSSRTMLLAIAILIAISVFGYLQSTTFYMLAACSVVLGVSQGAMVPLWSIIMAKLYGPDNMGRSMGLMGTMITPFTLVAPPLFGRIYDISGSYNVALLGYIALLSIIPVLVVMLREQRHS